jgi:hypothetical protein
VEGAPTPAGARVSRVVIGLLLLDGVLAVLLAMRMASADRPPSTAAWLYLAVLALGGAAAVGLWRGRRWGVWIGLIASAGALVQAGLALPPEILAGDAAGIARYGLRVAVSGFVFLRLLAAARA